MQKKEGERGGRAESVSLRRIKTHKGRWGMWSWVGRGAGAGEEAGKGGGGRGRGGGGRGV